MSYYISPSFLDKVAVHITKNFLDLPGVRVPLILGIHGRKGEGKTFQCELAFERLGFEPVTISGGELESPDAGDPARLIRLRYREAAEQIRVRGEMCAIFINDLDAGAGRFDSTTQYTVNTQLVNATLMNIADNPTNVQLPGSYDNTPLHRVPIIVTGNDFATLYAPLIRDGRMEKFYWEPNRDDKIGIVSGIFEADGMPLSEIAEFVDAFPDQAIDFFSALRSRIYDEQIREFIHKIGIEKVSKRLVNSVEAAPHFPKPNFSLSRLVEIGKAMVGQQYRVKEMRLVEEYNQNRLFGSQNPGEVSSNSQPQSQQENGQDKYYKAYMEKVSNGGNGKSSQLNSAVQEQVQQLLAQGCKIGIEYADNRRFKTGSWQSCATIQSNGEKEVIATLESCLAEHGGEYVRLIGIDSKAKRRVVETIIQRPNI
ncbi:ribulose bisphosphate carboxylase small subunit [Kamptonema sp. UHCC 0994]|uniref:ribulose bisphosphate carboxylase small subunit n=1 Tax=Kamptonema sp. UHCC 0994 TaxID=3031329 RepID=UPI0023BA3076|nr:ribulose bisphosphate carboxylase small subunit [Kamptonema sp. UHCC 0994]MDF0552160.1 ribulose bisphosphate carboxylase small subunit [Kamptonema sp. UHCC 0994]